MSFSHFGNFSSKIISECAFRSLWLEEEGKLFQVNVREKLPEQTLSFSNDNDEENEWRRSCFVFCLQDKTNVCVYSCITSLRFLFLFPPDYSVSVTLTTYVSLKTNEWVSIIFYVATADSSFNSSHVYNCKVSINLCQLLTNWMAHLWKLVNRCKSC